MITTTDQSEDKKANLKKLREFHTATINELGVSHFFLLGKMSYLDKGKKVISFFHSEISKGQDIFVEFTNRYNVPEFPDRTLYRWRFNPHFEEEYEKTDPHPVTGHIRYLVPTEELTYVKAPESTTSAPVVEPIEPIEFELVDANTDLPLDQLTIRDLAAIMLKRPVSQKPWLNEIIKQS